MSLLPIYVTMRQFEIISSLHSNRETHFIKNSYHNSINYLNTNISYKVYLPHSRSHQNRYASANLILLFNMLFYSLNYNRLLYYTVELHRKKSMHVSIWSEILMLCFSNEINTISRYCNLLLFHSLNFFFIALIVFILYKCYCYDQAHWSAHSSIDSLITQQKKTKKLFQCVERKVVMFWHEKKAEIIKMDNHISQSNQ